MVKCLAQHRSASSQLKNFTNRESELAVFQRGLARMRTPLPVLAFYGVGGNGKTWLIRRLAESAGTVPTALIDLEPRAGGSPLHTDSARALAEIRGQFEDVACPRFDLALAWLRFRQGVNDEPQFKGTGAAANVWEFLREAGEALADDVPGANVLNWLAGQVTKPVWERLKDTPAVKRLASEAGQEDYVGLKKMQPVDIYPELAGRLLRDLSENLPLGEGDACRGVILIDTFEALRHGAESETRAHYREGWVRDLYAIDSPVLIVIAGRDRLVWDEVDPDFRDEKYLEQHLVGGLSEQDALGFLSDCGIENEDLQEALLRVCSIEGDAGSSGGYHPYSLGLSVDTSLSDLNRGIEPDAGTFAMAPGDQRALALRFLKSLSSSAHEMWVKQLALSPRFDETAAREMFGPSGIEQESAWDTLGDYSFVREADTPGWWTLHSCMRDALVNTSSDKDEEAHQRWREHWSRRARTATDDFASLAWFHKQALDPVAAATEWKRLAENARESLRMLDHYRLLGWWDACDPTTRRPGSSDSAETQARALLMLGRECTCAQLGDRAENIQRGVRYYDAALRIYTESDFPADWAETQRLLGQAHLALPIGDRADNIQRAASFFEAALRIYTESTFPNEWALTQCDLGTAYARLPSGDEAENIERAVHCHEAALRIWTECHSADYWAMAQHRLGSVYLTLHSGDRTANLRRAIECYESALRIWTESEVPNDWASTQMGLGTAYMSLPTGDRAANVRRAIEFFEASLRVHTESNFPRPWAKIQHNLGVAYSSLPGGDGTKNLRRAIEFYEAALRVHTEGDLPHLWAVGQVALGRAYMRLPRGDSAEKLRLAIEFYEAALRVQTEANSPHDWATTQALLAMAYAKLPTGNFAENMQRAIGFSEGALRVWTESENSDRAVAQKILRIAQRALDELAHR